MVLTIEPGLYIPNDPDTYGPLAGAKVGSNHPPPLSCATPHLPHHPIPCPAGIGVRIEDDIAITADGHEVLSADVPVDPDALEALAGSAADSSSGSDRHARL